jgi:hypothetical protein
MRIGRVVWALVLLVPVCAVAAPPNLMSSFDVVDDVTGTGTDVLDLATIETATDADVKAVLCTDNSARCHNDANGGSSSSRFAGNLDLASGERGGWEQNAQLPFSYDQGTISFAVHWGSALGVSGDRELARWTRADATTGCNVRLTASRTFTLYDGATLVGTSTGLLTTNTCSDDPLRGCTTGADCVSGTCATCSTSTGAGCYWPTVELVQVNYPSGTGNRLQCQLWVQGVLEVDSGLRPVATTPALTGFEVGGPGTEAATLNLAFDDVVATPDARTGPTYLHWMTPAAGVLNGAIENNCGTGVTVQKCIGDYAEPSLVYRNFGTGVDDNIRTASAGRGFWVTRYTPQPTALPALASIAAVAAPIIGKTGTGAAWTTRTRIAQCAAADAACLSTTPAFDMAHNEQTTPILTGFPVATAPPAGGGSWNIAQLGTLGSTWAAQVVSGGNVARAMAGGAVVWVRRPDALPVANLRDHNLGTDDATTTVALHGDSTACGTGAASCQGGTLAGQNCNQATYCSWDDVNKSKPVGGCANNAECQTCALRRLEFNNGAGYACTGSCDLGTCSAGTCSGDPDVTCSTTPDCNLGSCATTATCEESCPGGTCPARTGFPAFAEFVSDTFLNCCQDGSTTGLVELSYFRPSLYGRSTNCALLWGAPGECTCATNAECQTTASGVCTKTAGNGRCSTSLWTACTVDGDCPGGETCLGLCTASDNGRNACTGPTVAGTATRQCYDDADPTKDRFCAFPPADYVLIATGVNDMNPGYPTADCQVPYLKDSPCDNCAETSCVSDAACAGLSATSQCFGALGASATGNGCFGPWGNIFESSCSTDSAPCHVSADCRGGTTGGQVCTGASGSPEKDGVCTCDADTDCLNSTQATGFKCSGGLCRRKCTTNADCGAVSGVCDGSGVCQGQCSCPCDAVSCSRDVDCPIKSQASGGVWPTRIYSGVCTAGKCAQCVGTTCASSPSTHGYADNYWRFHGGTYWARKARKFQGTIAGEAVRTADETPPLLIPMTFPNGTSQYHPECLGGVWNDLPNASQRNAAQLRSEFPHLIDVRASVDSLPDSSIYVDVIHPGVVGAVAWGRPIGVYLSTLNSCRTGLGADSVVAKYCRTIGGAWRTPDVVCASKADCTGTDTCVQRLCTVDNDTAAGCPGVPTCNLEAGPAPTTTTTTTSTTTTVAGTTTTTVPANITLVGTAKDPAVAGAANIGPSAAVVPPVAMQANDYVVVLACYRTGTTTTVSVLTTGGQTWTSSTQVSAAAGNQCRVFHARFNGTWTADPAFGVTAGTATIGAYMLVFRGVDPTTALDVAITGSAVTPIAPCDVATTGITTATDKAMAIFLWSSVDDNTWALQAGGPTLTQPETQWKVGTNYSFSVGYAEQTPAGATGTSTNRQTLLGCDGATRWSLALRKQS